MDTIIATAMADPAGHRRLVRLISWLSPAFPIGGFAYSQGLETVIADGRVRTGDQLAEWIGGQLHGAGMRTDAFFIAIAARAVISAGLDMLDRANALALALQPSAERDKETREQARSFLDAAAHWPLPADTELDTRVGGEMALPVAFGAMTGRHGIETGIAIAGYLNALVTQQISVAVRLIPLGQTRGLRVLAALEPQIASLARIAQGADLGDIGTIGYGIDIASMRHEDLPVRIFRS